MTNVQEKFSQKIKTFHIFILGCILSTFLIFNSNYVNERRIKDKLNEEKKILFNNIISHRILEETEKSDSSKVDEVCQKGSENLNNYYKTGNLGEIEIKKGSIKCEDKDADYMKALINIIKSQLGEKSDENEEKESNERRNLNFPTLNGGKKFEKKRNLEEEGGGGSEIPKDDIIAYGKHILPALFFLVVAILCIPGWIMCCFCCCCNCCCCCCCKKPCCKIPCFIITYALYALVVAVCFYGLSQSNHIFIGIADTECSILRFFDEILNGEIKAQPPKWAGIEGIKDILKDLNSQIKGMGTETADDLARELENIDS